MDMGSERNETMTRQELRAEIIAIINNNCSEKWETGDAADEILALLPTPAVSEISDIDLGCTGMDDHNSPDCYKCEGIKEKIAQALAAVRKEEREACAEELEKAFGECDTYNLLHGAARIRGRAIRAEKEGA